MLEVCHIIALYVPFRVCTLSIVAKPWPADEARSEASLCGPSEKNTPTTRFFTRATADIMSITSITMIVIRESEVAVLSDLWERRWIVCVTDNTLTSPYRPLAAKRRAGTSDRRDYEHLRKRRWTSWESFPRRRTTVAKFFCKQRLPPGRLLTSASVHYCLCD